MLRPQGLAHLPFSAAYGFDTLSLAHVLDSLVRVSRRVVQDRYVRCPTCENLSATPGWGKGILPEDPTLAFHHNAAESALRKDIYPHYSATSQDQQTRFIAPKPSR